MTRWAKYSPEPALGERVLDPLIAPIAGVQGLNRDLGEREGFVGNSSDARRAAGLLKSWSVIDAHERAPLQFTWCTTKRASVASLQAKGDEGVR